MHWNGTQWEVIPSPNVGPDHNILKAVTAISPNNVWAVGYYGPVGQGQALAMHWNGLAWQVYPTPVLGQGSYLHGIDSTPSGEVWAVGNYYLNGLPNNLFEKLDGTQWVLMPAPNMGGRPNYLWDVTLPATGEAWAVGEYGIEYGSTPMSINYLTHFTDVAPDSTFYPFVRCLVTQGVISGYADCTFRPNAEVTRGQLSKIVSNSAGYNDDPGPQMFQDVPPGSTFYDWVNRLASRGHISGYECGGVGEPCVPPFNLPYFRPNANATRGQISKIVSNAAGFIEPVSGQTYQDVPLNNPFYAFIERLTVRGVMSGYQCGSVIHEPCGPENRPYFRWGNNATRGQTSKIVANTFFPGCRSR
jgi:hypothetical protein